MKRKKAKKKARRRERTTMHNIAITLNREHTAYVDEIAEYACVTREIVCAVMMACGIFQARRFKVPDKFDEMKNQLQRARACMEANDPLNARDIFGPPTEAPAPAAPPTEPPAGATP